MNPDLRDATIPPDVLRRWQRIVDLLANVVGVPSAVVTQVELPDQAFYTTTVSSNSQGNPFPAEQIFPMDIGTFCETVIKSQEPLLVISALEQKEWTSAPEIGVGMISYLGFPVFWPDGRIFGTICVLDDEANPYSDTYQELLMHCRDVLQDDLHTLVRLGIEVEEQRAHLSELFARMPAALVMVDHDMRITRVNPGFTKMFGYSAEEAIGQRVRDIIAPGVGLEDVESDMYAASEAAGVVAVEAVRRHKDGTRIPVSLVRVPLSAGGAGSIGYLIYRDITESKRLEDEQRKYHDIQLELAHANRIATAGELSASIAHELRQPLTGIITNCGTCLRMLSSDPPNLDGVRDVVQRTMRDGHRASDVITRLHALFKHKQPATEPVDLNEATREVIVLLRGEFQNAGVAVRTDFADDLPSITADRVQLQQVILNLLRNALDATRSLHDRPGGLLIKTRADGSDWVTLSVTDNGVGFDLAQRARLFDAFYSTKSEGMGVGLSVSRSIIENHHGRISANLNDGPGATFSFSVPCESHS